MSAETAAPRVLVVDDEPNIVDVITMALRYQGFEAATAATGQEALAAVESFRPQVMILDVMLPDMEGFEVAERLGAERSHVPIIFLTARDATEDKLRGLTTGGDDYMTKPFSLEELVARIRVILRRTGGATHESRLSFEDVELDEDTREVTRAGEWVDLTATEYRLLHYLMLRAQVGRQVRVHVADDVGLAALPRRPQRAAAPFSRSASSDTLGRSSAIAIATRSVSSLLALSAITIRQRSGSASLR
jgi:two-component system OmpR family response regulator